MLFFVLNHAGQLHVISLRWRETNVQEKKGKKTKHTARTHNTIKKTPANTPTDLDQLDYRSTFE